MSEQAESDQDCRGENRRPRNTNRPLLCDALEGDTAEHSHGMQHRSRDDEARGALKARCICRNLGAVCLTMEKGSDGN